MDKRKAIYHLQKRGTTTLHSGAKFALRNGDHTGPWILNANGAQCRAAWSLDAPPRGEFTRVGFPGDLRWSRIQNKAKLQKFSALKMTRGADSEIHNMSNSVVERASICCGLYE